MALRERSPIKWLAQGWKAPRERKFNRPQVVAKYTDDLVYARLAPGILDELRKKNPKNEKGYRKARHHQWLTESIGHPALAQHIFAVIESSSDDRDRKPPRSTLPFTHQSRSSSLLPAISQEI
ncbi:MAG: P63C domain-containing protein [Xanthobacteraceae bacterium]|jgi:hypothetical protein